MNRLNEIRTNTEIKQWKYITRDLNPADMFTCYHSFQCLNSDSIWIRGLNFLCRNENENVFEYVIENNETENFNVNPPVIQQQIHQIHLFLLQNGIIIHHIINY